MLNNRPRAPLVSVVIPCLNRAHYLVQTIESVLQQDYPHTECIVIDGGSTDETLDILRRYTGRITWVSEPDHGPPDAINKGWKMSRGEILAWLNADDLWATGAVSKVVAHLQAHPEVDVVYGDCGIIDHEGKHIRIVRVRDWDIAYAVEHCDHIIFQAASFMLRSILERVGWLYPKLCHDHELWLRIGLAGGTLQHIPVVLAYARDHAGNLGYRSDLVIPLKVELTRKFFTHPALPTHFHRIRDRAVSNAYLRGTDYVLWDKPHWHRTALTSLAPVWKALATDPTNIFRTAKTLLRIARRIALIAVRPYLPDWLLRAVRAARYSLSVNGLRGGG